MDDELYDFTIEAEDPPRRPLTLQQLRQLVAELEGCPDALEVTAFVESDEGPRQYHITGVGFSSGGGVTGPYAYVTIQEVSD